MIKDIITDTEQLIKSSEEVNVKKEGNLLRQIVLDLKDTLRSRDDAIGLAAPQIGYQKRLFIINFGKEIKTFINPIINRASAPLFTVEKCLSCGDKEYIVLSFDNIEIFYQTPLGKIESGRLTGIAARVFQHELNHLDGVLISDHGLENSEEIQNLSDEERKDLFKRLAESLDLKNKEKDEKGEDIKKDESDNIEGNN